MPKTIRCCRAPLFIEVIVYIPHFHMNECYSALIVVADRNTCVE
jgi:hypothetical protein